MATVDDLRGAQAVAHVAASDEELQRIAPFVDGLSADLTRLEQLPLGEVEPAFTPRLSAREA